MNLIPYCVPGATCSSSSQFVDALQMCKDKERTKVEGVGREKGNV